MTHRCNIGRLNCLLAALSIDGPIYKRICNATIAARWMKNTRRYVDAMGSPPNYIDPSSYTEKMQCRKLFDRNPAFPVFCDKLSTRKYVAEKGFESLLPKLLWSGTDLEELPFDAPAPYIIKPSHSSGTTVIVQAGDVIDKQKILHTCKKWLRKRRSHGRGVGEWGYKSLRGQIMMEELLPAAGSALFADDYKVFTFGGHVEFIHVRSQQDMGRQGEAVVDAFYDQKWNRLPYCRWRNGMAIRVSPNDIGKPTCLNQMLAVAEKLAAGFDHLRVDFYVVEDTPVVGELTVYNESGFGYVFPEDAAYEDYPPRVFDHAFGQMWHQPNLSIATKLGRLIFG